MRKTDDVQKLGWNLTQFYEIKTYLAA